MSAHRFTAMAASIKASFEASRKAFRDFLDSVTSEELNFQIWQDEYGRLCMWAANIGAHQTGQSSLDFRLRDSSHIRRQLIKLLDEIPRRLQDVKEIVAECDDEDIESLNESEWGDERPQTEIQQLRGSVATTINCLFEMSMLVRKPAQRDHRMGSEQADVAYYEAFDLSHVRDKFPAADERLVARLGQANTRRRQYLRYRENHAIKLRQGLDPGTIGQGDSEDISESVAIGSPNPNIICHDQRSESDSSVTSYAPSLISGGNVTMPARPEASRDGKFFECPYCHFVITVRDLASWTRHVFYDLQPYICTEISCKTPDRLYTTKHEWLHHLRTRHSRDWSSLPRRLPFGGQDGGRNRDGLCRLCSADLLTKECLNQHVARHLQELALFLLPPTLDGLDEKNRSSEEIESDVSMALPVDTESGDDDSSNPRSERAMKRRATMKRWRARRTTRGTRSPRRKTEANELFDASKS